MDFMSTGAGRLTALRQDQKESGWLKVHFCFAPRALTSKPITCCVGRDFFCSRMASERDPATIRRQAEGKCLVMFLCCEQHFGHLPGQVIIGFPALHKKAGPSKLCIGGFISIVAACQTNVKL